MAVGPCILVSDHVEGRQVASLVRQTLCDTKSFKFKVDLGTNEVKEEQGFGQVFVPCQKKLPFKISQILFSQETAQTSIR